MLCFLSNFLTLHIGFRVLETQSDAMPQLGIVYTSLTEVPQATFSGKNVAVTWGEGKKSFFYHVDIDYPFFM